MARLIPPIEKTIGFAPVELIFEQFADSQVLKQGPFGYVQDYLTGPFDTQQPPPYHKNSASAFW